MTEQEIKSEIKSEVKIENKKYKQLAENMIPIGSKTLLRYAEAISFLFNVKNLNEVIVVGRGTRDKFDQETKKNSPNYVGKAIDVAEFVTKRILQDKVKISNIITDSEQFINKFNKQVMVSAIEITLTKF